MCAGNINAEEGATHATCDYCGMASTLPKVNDEKLVNLFNRADHFRRSNEFDKALAAYENILGEDSTSAEAHWRIVLCRYGIEYVEDPTTRRRVPTCHRTHYASILTDPDYIAALENAPDSITKSIYEEEAKAINDIQKGILAVANSEEPFDIFICYKETGNDGQRTVDSTLAQDIYYQLTNDGYRVFFSRITLEDRLGRDYEPYIFSALNSAKVMLVVGTKKEYFEAVWVKNEWSRYLSLMKDDRSRLLIPCYRDMDAYDMPDELSHLQSQDMGKIGFVQDLVRGVKKVVGKDEATKTQTVAAPVADVTNSNAPIAPGVESLMKRGWLFLEDEDWKQADEYFDRVLDINPEYAPAYIGKLCVELQITDEAKLASSKNPFEDMANYKKAVRFADEGYRATVEGYNHTVKNRIAKEERIAEERRIAEEKRKAEEKREADEQQIAANRRKAENERIAHEKKINDLKKKFGALLMSKDEIAAQQEEAEAKFAQMQQQYNVAHADWQSKVNAIRQQAESRKSQGLCQVCGGTLKGLFSKKCVQCGCSSGAMPSLPAEPQRPRMQGASSSSSLRAWINKDYTVSVSYEDMNWEAVDKRGEKIILQSDQGEIAIVNGAVKLIAGETYPFGGIVWRVLTVEGKKALLISEKILEKRPYHQSKGDITWEHCTLRNYLNGEFYNKLGAAKTSVVEVRNNNPNNPWFRTVGGKATNDKEFLLSIDEVVKYFGDSGALRNGKSKSQIYSSNGNELDDQYNKARKAEEIKRYGLSVSSGWWLRSPGGNLNIDRDGNFRGGNSECAAAVQSMTGSVYVWGWDTDKSDGVRPALWLNL